MSVMSYSKNISTNRVTQPVSIISVNPSMNPPQATGITRSRTYIQIDIGHLVGAVQVVPSVGEQWVVIQERGIWKLDRQLPFGLPSMKDAVEGQTNIGSSGPTEIVGSQINFNAPTRSLSAPSSSRPEAASVPVGSQIYDTTLNKPLWSDGTSWRDAAGSTV